MASVKNNKYAQAKYLFYLVSKLLMFIKNIKNIF